MYTLRKTGFFLLSCLGLFALPVDASQEELRSLLFPTSEEKVRIDHCVFADENPELIRLEVYYQLYNSSLEFKPEGDLFKASYYVEVKIRTNRGKRVTSDRQEKSIVVSSVQKTKSSTDYRTSQVNFSLKAGKYDVEFTLRDDESNKIFSKEFEVKLKRIGGKFPQLSDILFAQGAGVLKEKPAQFSKGDMTVIPSVSHQYGGEEKNRLLFYVEIYPGSRDLKQATVQTLVRLKKGKMVYRDTLTTNLDRPVIRQLREISLEGFEPGEYELEVELKGRRGKKLNDQKGSFRIRWTEESLMQHNFDVIIKQLSIISGPKELAQLKEAESLEEKKKALSAYWSEKDPYPETPANEARIEFYRRVRMANANFAYLGRPGWESDRGRVMIRYGTPDQIEDYPFSLSTYPYQEWHYYRGGRYRKFTFVDDNHDGDYRLIYPYDGLGQSPDF